MNVNNTVLKRDITDPATTVSKNITAIIRFLPRN